MGARTAGFMTLTLLLLWGLPVRASPSLEPPWYPVGVNQVGVAQGKAGPVVILVLSDAGGRFEQRWFRVAPPIGDATIRLATAALTNRLVARVQLGDTAAGALVTRFFLTDSPNPPDPDVCDANVDCAEGQYCAKKPGGCDGPGVCAPIPEVCTDQWDPVCGCDGTTYGNPCEAAGAGVPVDHAGECVASCRTNADCGDRAYCAKKPGDCLGMGACAPRPDLCPMVWQPVCGCDGTTYGNPCEASAAGEGVAAEGVCK